MTTCPTELELDHAISVGLDREIAAHVDACPRCQAICDATHQLMELAREIPVVAPSGPLLEDRRTAILAAFTPEPTRANMTTQRRWPLVVAGAGVMATAGIVLAIVSAGATATDVAEHLHRGTVNPHDGARFTLAAQPPDEIVRLRDGVIDIDVDPLAAGERFRVIVGADQVEVRGTSFEVVASADRLVAVRVVHGRVEVTVAGARPVVLGNGEAWRATTISTGEPAKPLTVAPPIPPVVLIHPVHGARAIAPAPRPIATPTRTVPRSAADSQEVAFNQGWDAMRQGEYGQAAAAFNRAVALAPDGALAEDATFWHAVAIARLHRASEAIVALRSFIDAFPTSTRAGEASAMLGWLLLDAHELDEARSRFQAATHDPSAPTRTSAQTGLQATVPASR